MFYISDYASPYGKIVLASDGESLIGAWFEGQKYFCSTINQNITYRPELHILKESTHWLNCYFRKQKPSPLNLKLAPSGNSFRKDVWEILCKIPYGKVITYGEIATQIAKMRNIKSMSAQAIGGAVGHNPISIIIPCHRVVGKNGTLTGYASGLTRKQLLLKHEDSEYFSKYPDNKLYIYL